MPSVDLIGSSAPTRQLIAECERIAGSRSKVLLTGESGAGKEVFAHLIHQLSSRRNGKLITINCAGVPETLLESELFGHVRGSFTDAHRDRRGLFELADGGTVFLDEVGEMSLRMQALLLRFVETGEIQRVGSDQSHKIVDVRLLAATNRDLWEEVRKKNFREDLYYRLNVVHLIVPPLRHRRDDIAPLLEYFIARTAASERVAPCTLSAEALLQLQTYGWPGNVRELKNVAERLVVGHSDATVEVADLPREVLRRRASDAGSPKAAVNPWHSLVAECYSRIRTGEESFWSAVYDPFLRRDLTRDVVRALVRRGLEETCGNYPKLSELFNLSRDDHRRFMRFLRKYDCHMPVHSFRAVSGRDDRSLIAYPESVAV